MNMGRQSNSGRSLLRLGVISFYYAMLASTIHAQTPSPDVVTIFNNKTKKMQTYRGTIVSYDYDELKLQLVSGREQLVPSSQISNISSKWNADYIAAEGYMFERRFERASISFRQAYSKEARQWVKHRITAKIIQCEQQTLSGISLKVC